jgi:hypothetical protein
MCFIGKNRRSKHHDMESLLKRLAKGETIEVSESGVEFTLTKWKDPGIPGQTVCIATVGGKYLYLVLLGMLSRLDVTNPHESPVIANELWSLKHCLQRVAEIEVGK